MDAAPDQLKDSISVTYQSSCMSAAHFDFSCSTLLLIALCVYLIIAMVTNLIGLYKVVVIWNMIIDQQRLDLPEFYKRRRRMTYKETLRLHVVGKQQKKFFLSPQRRCCSVCISDFEENEIVTCCEEGCRNWFHKDCLFEWLDRSENCPCCRRDMLARKSRGFFADLSACMGFTPRTR
jgi:hypothetical protein